ncbi:MAG: glycosyltransferase family 4 protein [Paucibacter sp.]|nr:glycosyltransferase family 4 protein [Roseateles sp.]
MKIAVDARSLSTRPTGVGQYLMAAVNVWSEQQPELRFALLSNKPLHAAAEAALAKRENVEFHCCPTPLLADNGLWWLISHFERCAREQRADLLWGAAGLLPPTTRMPGLLTVHDLVYRSLPETMALRTRIAYGLLAGRSIIRADRIWAVSRFTAGEVERHYPRRKSRELITGSGLNPLREQHRFDPSQLDELRQRYRVTERSLLFVGTLEPRKNLRFLISLMPALAAQGFQLIVVGCSGWGRSDLADVLKAPGFPADAVRFCDYVSDADLQGLYKTVALFVSTSLMEGFGLPQLEAMAAGCPVVAAANSAMIEVVGDGGHLVEGWAPKDWISAIEAVYAARDDYRLRAVQAAAMHEMAHACAQAGVALDGLR